MKHELPCEVVKDVLPLYIDGLTSEETKQYVTEHLSTCGACKKTYDGMIGLEESQQVPDFAEKAEVDFLKKQKRKNRNVVALLLATVLAAGTIIAVYATSIEQKRDFRSFALEAVRGDTFAFGTYEQDGDPENGAEDIVWIVLSNKDGVIHAISKYGLDSKPYHEEQLAVTWEECSLRAWLNSTFYETAFSNQEKGLIKETELNNWDNLYYGTKGGNPTLDKVSLLSQMERDVLIFDAAMYNCFPTAYGTEQGIFPDPQTGHCIWWLRSPGINDLTVEVGEGTWKPVDSQDVAVRPAIYIEY